MMSVSGRRRGRKEPSEDTSGGDDRGWQNEVAFGMATPAPARARDDSW
jgi:hypothetical protein